MHGRNYTVINKCQDITSLHIRATVLHVSNNHSAKPMAFKMWVSETLLGTAG